MMDAGTDRRRSLGIGAFSAGGYRGEVAVRHRPADLAVEVARVTDPASARRTLHWGRNYLYTVQIAGARGPVEVVVKQFREQRLRDRVRRRLAGSKAARSWKAAHALLATGVDTPEPVMMIEPAGRQGPSFYVSCFVDGAFEARYLFRALNAGRERELFPQVEVRSFICALGSSLRRLHEGGFWHRDVSPGNLLVLYPSGDEPAPRLYLVDLNRARFGRRLTVSMRTRDLCRLPLFRPEHRELLLRSYWREDARAYQLKKQLYLLFHRGFLLKNRLKQIVRMPLRTLSDLLSTREPHPHIPPPPASASARDRVVWDRLSDQPHQHAGRLQRLSLRIADAGDHAEAMVAVAAAAPRIWERYRDLRRRLYAEPQAFGEAGIALRPWDADPEGLLGALEELGLRRVLLRLHPWERCGRPEVELARELAARGYELTFAVPQNRELVRDRERWRGAVTELGERFSPFGRRFQIGQAINRSKWGIWTYREYLDLAATACEILRRFPGVEILGPAVIDFEFQALAAVLNMRTPDVRFDVVSSLLYVDRRGAPESRQLGFDTVGKVLLLRAIAETGRNCGERCWITEVNWPLWEGPHAPAGRKVAVDEQTQADYLSRYFLLALGSGLVERVYWWQLVARGYGLIDPSGDHGELRRRPSFLALANLAAELEGTTRVGRLAAPAEGHLFLFRRADGSEVVAGWSSGGPVTGRLPRPAREIVERDGRSAPGTDGPEVRLVSSPRFFRLID